MMEPAAVASLSTVAVLGADDVTRDRVGDILEAHGLEVRAQGAPPPDVVVLIESDSDNEPAKQVRELLEELPEALVVLVAAEDGNGAVPSALRAGASGFVPIETFEIALGPTVQAVVAGQVSIPQSRRSELDRQPLTTREKQTLALVVMGMTNAEIATKLFLAESTVKSHLSSAFGKLGVRSRNEAAAVILDPHSSVGMGILTIPTEKFAPPA